MAVASSIEIGAAAEVTRKSLLADSDALLDAVEMLRLEDEEDAPLRLREAIRALQIRLGRRNPPVAPVALAAAHDLVFAVQQRIMAANPNHPRPSRHIGRPSGQPLVTVIRENRKWKVLTLPAPNAARDEGMWLELVDGMVERAWDRWCYAQQQAMRAAREHFKPHLAVAIAEAAWKNYWLLLQDSERLKDRVRAPLAAGTSSAQRP